MMMLSAAQVRVIVGAYMSARGDVGVKAKDCSKSKPQSARKTGKQKKTS
jgi:hypothetical protein